MTEIAGQNSKNTIKPDQDFIAAMAGKLKEDLLGIIDKLEGDLTIDFGEVKKIDSIGLGILVATQNSLGKAGKKLSVINASESICRLFEMTHLNRFFTVASCDE